MKSNLIDLTLEFRGETASGKAIHCHDGDKSIFLPISQIEYVEIKPGYVEVTMPEWLAMEKELI